MPHLLIPLRISGLYLQNTPNLEGIMKGLVFTEFMSMVETKFGLDMIDDLIEETQPESGGAYTAVGTYSHQELVDMVVKLAEKTGAAAPDLIRIFGNHLAVVFATKFPSFFEETDNTLEFLKKIDNHIHIEVRKLYPDAELPVFQFDDSVKGEFKLVYSSERGFGDLALGLMEGVSKFYGESFNIARTDSLEGKIHISEFILRKAA
jgi:hypothetical protein